MVFLENKKLHFLYLTTLIGFTTIKVIRNICRSYLKIKSGNALNEVMRNMKKANNFVV